MLIGVISDTHDHVSNSSKAVEIFNDRGCEAVLHCGDFVSPFSMVPFKKLEAPLFAIFGNNDGEKEGLGEMFNANGWTLNDRPWELSLGGKKIAMLHEPSILENLVERGEHDLIVYGHLHLPFIEKRGKTLIVNPGEGCGWVKKRATLALVDLAKLTAEIHDIDLKQ